MSRKLTILFSTIDGLGHLNACIGLGEILHDRGHRVVFALPLRWKGQVAPLGFEEALYETPDDVTQTGKDGESKWGTLISKSQHAFSLPSIEHHKYFHLPMYQEMFSQVKHSDTRMREIMDTVQPDVVVVDTCYQTPALIDQGVPWILATSFNPLGISNQNTPPAWSGYAVDSDPKTWKVFEDEMTLVYNDFMSDYNSWMVQHGARPQPTRMPYFQEFSPWANMYVFPEELDYTSVRPNPSNWFQFDTFMKRQRDPTPFEIPEKLKHGSGKLIYFSMGTIGCINIPLMTRLLQILAKSPNRFIISKGPLGAKLELGSNMWGEAVVPQTKVIPQVDLVITHGGNNTLTESFYYGTPVMVLPLLWDQLDNAQRIYETGFGLKFHPYKVSEQELLNGIEKMLDNDLLAQHMRHISKRIQASKSKERAADLIQTVADMPRVQNGAK